MITAKSEKELAYLRDLFIATDWGERFAELIDEHVKLPQAGQVLYLNAGTGSHAVALQERAGEDVQLLCVDESAECLELARAKVAITKAKVTFHRGNLEDLNLSDDDFDLVVGDASLAAPKQVGGILSEMVRVAATGATVAIVLPTFSSFGEFFSVYWEALHNSGFEDHELDVETLITHLPTVSDVEAIAEHEGLADVTSWTQIEEFDYDSGEAFINSPLIADFLMKNWLEPLPAAARKRVTRELVRIINEDRHEAEFSLTVKATLVTGRKLDLPLAG